jgi:hypothetical protein
LIWASHAGTRSTTNKEALPEFHARNATLTGADFPGAFSRVDGHV